MSDAAGAMMLEDLADLTQEAFLVIRHGLVAHANEAARALLEACGRRAPVVGQPVEGLRAACAQAAITAHRPPGSDASEEEYVLRLELSRPAAQDVLIAAVNEAPDAILVIDPRELAYVGLNEAAARIYDIPRQVMMQQGVLWVCEKLGLGSPAEVSHAQAGLIARHPAAETSLFEFTRGDGRMAVIESTRRAIQVDGKWLIVTVGRDVTAARAEHKRLLRLQAAFNAASEGMVVIDPRTMSYVEVNEEIGRVNGLSSRAMMERGLAWTIERVGTAAGRETMAELSKAYQALIAQYPYVEYSAPEVLQDGRVVTYEATRRAIHVDGDWFIVGVSRDITERVAEQQRLERLSAAVNEAADAIMVIDPQAMEYLDVNDAAGRLHGVSRQTILERQLPWLVHQLGVQTVEEVRREYLELIERAPEAQTQVFPVHRDDETVVMVEATRRAVRIDGKWLIISVSRDVTDRLQAEERLKRQMQELARSNSDLEQFAYVTSHDLSEPLRMVASYTQLIARRYTNVLDEDGREFMGFVISGAQRMKRLIDDLLAYSRAGRADARMTPMSLAVPLDDAIENLGYAIEKSGGRVERPAQLPEVVCDKTGMTHLFQNLIANALKFKGAQAPVVRIEAAQEDDGWTISVSDNGIGIDPAHFERVFVVFQRLHARDAYEGTGIGLSICKKIVERHGGRIWVESQPGAGASFRFHLPLSPQGRK